MKLDELTEVQKSYTHISKGKPSASMTDKQWQEQFQILKAITIPSRFSKMRLIYLSDADNQNYHGDTIYSYYCRYINNVLESIRSGKHDFCYFTYQIIDLLKYEKHKLMSKYHPQDQVFEVWIEGGAE